MKKSLPKTLILALILTGSISHNNLSDVIQGEDTGRKNVRKVRVRKCLSENGDVPSEEVKLDLDTKVNSPEDAREVVKESGLI